MLKLPIYLDNHATTPCDPRVLAAMLPYFSEQFGNASSSHPFGRAAADAVQRAREQVAALIHCCSDEVVFSSGATEANNLALKGAAEACRSRGNHIITARTEHPAVLDTCAYLETQGFHVTYLTVDRYGRVHPDDLRKAITSSTILVSIMLANNEIGTIQPVAELAGIAREKDIVFHSDAVQALGKIQVDVQALGVDMISITAHKVYGPKGVGALYVRHGEAGVKLAAQIHGGGQEYGLRSGTLNVPGIVGLGKACQIALEEMEGESRRISTLRDRLHARLTTGLEHTIVNGHPVERLPGCLSISFRGVEAGAILTGLTEVAVSAGSACHSTAKHLSHVLEAIGLDRDAAFGTLRLSIGRWNTEEEIDYAADRVIETVERLRQMSPLWEG